jgi:hypothetical protein
VLLAYLRRAAGPVYDLDHYHAAAALFTLLGFPDEPLPELRKRAQCDLELFGGEAGRQRVLNEVKRVLQKQTAAG